jgi:hypothetical protein
MNTLHTDGVYSARAGASRWVGVLWVYLYGSWGCVVMDLGTSQRAFKVLHILLLDQ